MLNREERFTILKLIQYYCIIGCFPVTVDLSTCQLLTHSQTGKRRWPSLVCIGCFIIHAVYKITTFIGACLLKKSTPLHELAIHGFMAIGGPIITFWYYLFFIEHSDVFGAYLQMSMTGNIGGSLSEDKRHTSWTNRLKEYAIRDLYTITLPYMVAAVIAAYLLTLICYPQLQLQLYAGLPEGYQTWLSFTVLLLEEMRYIVVFCVVATVMWTLQLISFDLVNNRLKLLIHSIERATTIREFRRIYSYLRHFQLYVTIINVVNCYLIFSWKLYCITICICSGYAAIAHFTEHPVFGVLYYLMLINCTFFYTIIYGKAFKIPELFERATKKAILLPTHRGAHRDAQIIRRQMRSVPSVGIKVGEFHTMERQSVLIFVHYVLSNIVSMLVAYKH